MNRMVGRFRDILPWVVALGVAGVGASVFASKWIQYSLASELGNATDAGLGKVLRLSGDGIDVQVDVGLRGKLKKGMVVHAAAPFEVYIPPPGGPPAIRQRWVPSVGEAVLLLDPPHGKSTGIYRKPLPAIPLRTWGPNAANRAKMVVAVLDGPNVKRRADAALKLLLSDESEDRRSGRGAVRQLGESDQHEITRRIVPLLSCKNHEDLFPLSTYVPVRDAIDLLERVLDCVVDVRDAESLLRFKIPQNTGCETAWSREAPAAEMRLRTEEAIACARAYYADVDAGRRPKYHHRGRTGAGDRIVH